MANEPTDYAGEFFKQTIIPSGNFTVIAIVGFFALTYFVTSILGLI